MALIVYLLVELVYPGLITVDGREFPPVLTEHEEGSYTTVYKCKYGLVYEAGPFHEIC